jgi:hypothetical protein
MYIMKRKIVLTSSIVLAIIVLAACAVPVFAASDAAGTASTTQGDQVFNKARILVRLLLIQDEAKVDKLIAAAVKADKLSDEQAGKLKAFWTRNHQQFISKVFIKRLLRMKDGAKVQGVLDNFVAAGKIKAEQGAKIMAQWNKLHSK